MCIMGKITARRQVDSGTRVYANLLEISWELGKYCGGFSNLKYYVGSIAYLKVRYNYEATVHNTLPISKHKRGHHVCMKI